jgi:pyocin large subunit-like protein
MGPVIRQFHNVKRQRLRTCSSDSKRTTTANDQRCLMMRCIESESRILAEVVEGNAQDLDDDMSHLGLVGDQSCRRKSVESKLGQDSSVSCMPVTSGSIA